MVSITNFEKTIESKIVKRGREYYEDDLVDDLEETEKDHFIATVLGSDDYKVEIILSEDNIHEHFCDCPYDYGEFCKHEVAVLFSILDQYKVDKIEDVEQKVKESKSSEKIDLADILETVSHKELKEFVLSYACSDIHFKNTLIRNFAETSGNTMSFQAYQKQIKDIYKSGKDRYGFIEWRLMKKVEKQLIAFLSEIQKNLNNSNQAAAFYMSSALLEESVGMAGFCDDSDGYLTEIIEECFNVFNTIVLSELKEDLRLEIMSYGLKAFEEDKFQNWGSHIDLLDTTSKLIRNEAEADHVLLKIQSVSENGYSFRRSQNLKYEILMKWKTRTEAEEFLNENRQNVDLRTKIISNAVNSFDYEKAKEMANDGIICDKIESPGYVNIWYGWLLTIAELEDDRQNIILYAKYLFINSFQQERDYYKILKENVAENDWLEFIDKMISDILIKDSYYRGPEKVADLYVQEKRWENLFELIKKSDSIRFLELYEKYITDIFFQEIINIYIKFINTNIDEASSRSGYKSICKYLKKIKKMGASEKVKEMVQDYKAKYPRKRALIEELDKV